MYTCVATCLYAGSFPFPTSSTIRCKEAVYIFHLGLTFVSLFSLFLIQSARKHTCTVSPRAHFSPYPCIHAIIPRPFLSMYWLFYCFPTFHQGIYSFSCVSLKITFSSFLSYIYFPSFLSFSLPLYGILLDVTQRLEFTSSLVRR